MQKLFIETSGFTRRLSQFIDEATYTRFQNQLMSNPAAGVVMPGCGGLRKIRIAEPKRGKGKRSGLRVIYLHVPEANWILLLDIYEKAEADDLTPDEKKVLKQLAAQFKAEARKAIARKKGRTTDE